MTLSANRPKYNKQINKQPAPISLTLHCDLSVTAFLLVTNALRLTFMGTRPFHFVLHFSFVFLKQGFSVALEPVLELAL